MTRTTVCGNRYVCLGVLGIIFLGIVPGILYLVAMNKQNAAFDVRSYDGNKKLNDKAIEKMLEESKKKRKITSESDIDSNNY